VLRGRQVLPLPHRSGWGGTPGGEFQGDSPAAARYGHTREADHLGSTIPAD
jgi:hypothetical protein